MKKPKNWTIALKNSMVFNIFAFWGWFFLEERRGKETIKKLIHKIDNETLDEKDRLLIALYVPRVFFPLLFKQLKKKDRLNDTELKEAWGLYITFLTSVHEGKIVSENPNGSLEKLTTNDVINRCKSRLTALEKAYKIYSSEEVDYFCYLAQQVVNELKKISEN